MMQARAPDNRDQRWMAVNRATTKRYVGNLKRLGSKVPPNAPPGDERAMPEAMRHAHRSASHLGPVGPVTAPARAVGCALSVQC